MKNLINLDQLHRNIELIAAKCPHLHQRQRGITTAYLYLLLGEAWLGDHENSYLYIGESRLSTERMCRDFLELIQEHIDEVDGKITHFTTNALSVDSRHFQFVPAKAVHSINSTTFHRIFLDLSEETRESVITNEVLASLCASLHPNGDFV